MNPRVLHVSASFPRSADDHVAPFLLDLVQLQAEGGWEVSAVAAHDAGLPVVHDVGGVPVRRVRYAPEGLEVLVYRGGGHASLQAAWHVVLLPFLALGLLVGLWREVRARRPDTLVAHFFLPGGAIAALVPTRARRVLTLHGNDVVLAARLPRLFRLVAGRFDVITAVSGALARRAEELLGRPPGTVGVTRLPVPAGVTTTPVPPGPPRLLAAGRASREKGFDVLLDALARPQAAAWSATLVTDGPERADLERRAAALGGRVRLLPAVPRPQLMDLVREHHVIVVPSRSEGLGLFAVEAVASGRRVIASNVGGLPEAVTDGQDGILVPAEDPDALAAALAAIDHTEPPVGTSAARHGRDAVLAATATSYFGGDPT